VQKFSDNSIALEKSKVIKILLSCFIYMAGKFQFYAFKLAGIIILIFLAQLLIPGFTELFLLDKEVYFQIWRFFTAIFLHADLTHLIFNLFGLVLFGSILESFIGGKRFLFVFISTGILANVLSVNFYASSLGASGAIFGVIGALIFLKPMLVVWTYGLPMPLFIAGVLWAAADILGVFGFGQTGIGNIAHLSGLVFGLLFGFYFRGLIVREKRRLRFDIDERAVRNWEEEYMR